ncbi:MAG: NUDIX hydrolase [Proteobacteria bacterium]|nr:NUDIX hydrolase [Pseudomonadota bacterium]
MSGDAGWRTRASRLVFESRWFRLQQDDVTLPSGEDITYTWLDHPGFAVVVPLLDDGRVVMERVYRHPLRRSQLECPSGGLDGDPPEVGARRELEEETGYRAGRLDRLGRFAGSSGRSNEEFDAFLARDLRADGRMSREPTETMELELVPLPELLTKIRQGRFEDAPSALALLLAADFLRREAGAG